MFKLDWHDIPDYWDGVSGRIRINKYEYAHCAEIIVSVFILEMNDKLELFTSVQMGILKYQGSNKIRKIFYTKTSNQN